MNKQQALVDVLTGNKLIEEFMGMVWGGSSYAYPNDIEVCDDTGDSTAFPFYFPSDLEYHSSWDWLIPAIKKFDNLYEGIAITFSKDYEFWCDKIDDKVTRTYEIEPVFKILIEAIQWYNTQTKKQ